MARRWPAGPSALPGARCRALGRGGSEGKSPSGTEEGGCFLPSPSPSPCAHPPREMYRLSRAKHFLASEQTLIASQTLRNAHWRNARSHHRLQSPSWVKGDEECDERELSTLTTEQALYEAPGHESEQGLTRSVVNWGTQVKKQEKYQISAMRRIKAR